MMGFSSRTELSRDNSVGHLEQSATIEYRHELVRKAIHLCSLSIPIVYYFITREQALWILVPMTISFFVIDVARFYSTIVSRWFYLWFGWLLRRHEQDTATKRLSGATNVLISACFCVLIFPKVITINAFAILIVSDTTSALIGRRFGKRPFFGKSVEGSFAFFVSAVIVVLVAPKVERLLAEYFLAIVACAVGAVVEAASGKIDDNISIPLSVGITMWLLYLLFLPTLDLSHLV
jgi:dolichol kinase